MLGTVTLSVPRASSDNFVPRGGVCESWCSSGHPVSQGVSACTLLPKPSIPSVSHAEQSPSLRTVHRPRRGFQLLESHHPIGKPRVPPPRQPRHGTGTGNPKHTVQRRRGTNGGRHAALARRPAALENPLWVARGEPMAPGFKPKAEPWGNSLSVSQFPRSFCECRRPPHANTFYKPPVCGILTRAEEEDGVGGARAALLERMLGGAFQKRPGGTKSDRSRDRGRTLGEEPASQC